MNRTDVRPQPRDHACAWRGCSALAPVRSTPDRNVRRGLASWYGVAFDERSLRLAASRSTAPSSPRPTATNTFDSRVRVRNLNNDREAERRVNDRVPREALNNGRILDDLLRRRETARDGEGRCRPHRDHRLDVGALPVNRASLRGLPAASSRQR